MYVCQDEVGCILLMYVRMYVSGSDAVYVYEFSRLTVLITYVCTYVSGSDVAYVHI